MLRAKKNSSFEKCKLIEMTRCPDVLSRNQGKEIVRSGLVWTGVWLTFCTPANSTPVGIAPPRHHPYDIGKSPALEGGKGQNTPTGKGEPLQGGRAKGKISDPPQARLKPSTKTKASSNTKASIKKVHVNVVKPLPHFILLRLRKAKLKVSARNSPLVCHCPSLHTHPLHLARLVIAAGPALRLQTFSSPGFHLFYTRNSLVCHCP